MERRGRPAWRAQRAYRVHVGEMVAHTAPDAVKSQHGGPRIRRRVAHKRDRDPAGAHILHHEAVSGGADLTNGGTRGRTRSPGGPYQWVTERTSFSRLTW